MDKEQTKAFKKNITDLTKSFKSNMFEIFGADLGNYPEIKYFSDEFSKLKSQIKPGVSKDEINQIIDDINVETSNTKILAEFGASKTILKKNLNQENNLEEPIESPISPISPINDDVNYKHSNLPIIQPDNVDDNEQQYPQQNYNIPPGFLENISKTFEDSVNVVSGHANEVLGDTKSDVIDPVVGLGSAVTNIFGDGEETPEEETHGILSELTGSFKDFAHNFGFSMEDSVKSGMEETNELLQEQIDQEEERSKRDDRNIPDEEGGGFFGNVMSEALGGMLAPLLLMGKAIPLLIGGLVPVVLGLGTVAVALNFVSIEDIIKGFKNIGDKLAPSVESLTESLNSMVDGLLPHLEDLISGVIPMLVSGVEWFAEAVSNFIPLLIESVKEFSESEYPGMIKNILITFGGLIKNITSIIGDLVIPIIKTLDFLMTPLIKWYQFLLWSTDKIVSGINTILTQDFNSFFILPSLVAGLLSKVNIFKNIIILFQAGISDINYLFEIVTGKIGKVTKGIKTLFEPLDKIDDLFKAGKIGAGTKNFANILTGLNKIPVLGKMFSGILKFTNLTLKSMSGALKFFKLLPDLFGRLAWPLTVILSSIDFIKAFISEEGNFADKMTAGASAAVKGIIELPAKILGWMGDKILGLFGVEIEGGLGQKIVDGLMNSVNTSMDILKNLFSLNLIEAFKGIAKLPFTILGWIGDKILGLFGIEIDGGIFKTVIDKAMGFFDWLWESLKNAIVGMIPGAGLFKKLFDGKSEKEKNKEKDKELTLKIEELKKERETAPEKGGFFTTTKNDISKEIEKLKEEKREINYLDTKDQGKVVDSQISQAEGIQKLVEEGTKKGSLYVHDVTAENLAHQRINKVKEQTDVLNNIDKNKNSINQVKSSDTSNSLNITDYTSAATGGMIQGTGLVNVHAGEVIGPLDQVRDMIQTETFNEFEEYIKNKPNNSFSNVSALPKVDITIIDRINKEISDAEHQKSQVQFESVKEQNMLLEQNRASLVRGFDGIRNDNKETNNNSIVNNQQTVIPPEKVPDNIENMGVFLINSNWI